MRENGLAEEAPAGGRAVRRCAEAYKYGRGRWEIVAVTAGQVLLWIEELAPGLLAEEWDNVGLQCGNLSREVTRVMTALTVTRGVVEQAAQRGAELVVAHHPVIFRPLARIDAQSPPGAVVHELVARGIACIAAHTNLDAAPGGVNDGLARRLGLRGAAPLIPSPGARVDKLVTFVPPEHADAVRDAIARAGGGEIGEYTHCTFGALGVGTFIPGDAASPFIGSRGSLSRVEEVRLEAVLPRRVRRAAVAGLRAAHPYEEVPIDIYPLEDAQDPKAGIGRIGHLPEAMSVEEFLAHVQKSLELARVRAGGARPERIERVAVVGGSGGSFVSRARALGADALVTGDVDYHDADLARSLGLLVVDAGHFGTERHVPLDLAAYLAARANEQGVLLEVEAAREEDAFFD